MDAFFLFALFGISFTAEILVITKSFWIGNKKNALKINAF